MIYSKPEIELLALDATKPLATSSESVTGTGNERIENGGIIDFD